MRGIRKLILPIAAVLLVASTASADPITFDYTISSRPVGNNSDPANTAWFGIRDSGTATLGLSSPGTIMAYATYSGVLDELVPFTLPLYTEVPISVTVSLTDVAAKAVPGAAPSGTLIFNDLLSGQWNHAMDAWYLTSFPSPKTITLGSPGQFHTYHVNAPYLSSPGFGDLFAVVPVQVSDYQPGRDPAPGAVSAAPEPASLLIAALGLPMLIAARRRHWRNRFIPARDSIAS